MKYLTTILSVIILFTSCKNNEDANSKSKEQSTQTSNIQNINKQKNKEQTKQLIIEGENIWVRDTPQTGKVIMKLNTGDICKILEESKEVQVRNMLDKWYKIQFNDTIGWVFGSQTNLKTGKTIEIEDFHKFLEKFATKLKTQDFSEFIHKDIGINIMHNPGAFCILDNIASARIPITQDLKLSKNNIYNKQPIGHFCDGYPNTKDGIYYWQIKEKDLPASADMSDENNIKSVKLKVPEKYKNNTIYKVQIIKDEYHNSYFYFINIGKTWYLLCENYCDCSA